MELTMTISKQITTWINSHKYFKYSGMIESLGMDQGNFARTLQALNPRIEPKIAEKIVAILEDYGFTPVDNQLVRVVPDRIYPGTYAAPLAEKILLSKKKKLTVPKKILDAVTTLKPSKAKKESDYIKKRRQIKSK